MKHIILTAVLLCGLILPLMAQDSEPLCQVRIITEPDGATVSCDGVLRNASPVSLLDLQPGDHLLTVEKKGYKKVRRTVSVMQGEKVAVRLQLEPILGLILVHSNPDGAEVQIDGADRGKTPLFMSDLPFGKYRLRLAKTGYLPKEIDLSVEKRVPQKIESTLTSDSAVLILESDPTGASVVLNGIARGAAPCTIDRVPAGDSILEVTLKGYEPYKRMLKLRAGDKEEITAVLKPVPAELTVVSIPSGARLYINNQFRGNTPMTFKELDPGRYRVRVELTAHDPLARTVQLKRMDKIVEEFRLERNCGVLELTTEPAGVKVFMDGKEVGATTAKQDTTDRISDVFQLDLLIVGPHQLQLSKKGYFSRKFPIEMEKDQTIVLHQKLKRRFIPNYELRTATGVIEGLLIHVDPKGNVRMEMRPGVFKTFPANDVRSLKPLREQPGE